MKRVLAVLVLAISAAAVPAAAALKAGAAKVEITPPPGLLLWGYTNRTTPAKGARDPLFARVLVLDSGANRVAIVSVDLGRPFGPASLAWLRAECSRSAGVPNVVLAATHTHAGPLIDDRYPDGGTPAWEKETLSKIASAIAAALRVAVPARVGTGYGQTQIGHNRRRINADGSVEMFWRNETRIVTAPVDPTVGVVRIDDSAGNPLAFVLNYACHPVTFGSANLEYSADYPGRASAIVEQKFGNGSVCLFLQGAPGDINPFYTGTFFKRDVPSMRDWAADRVGQEAIRVARQIETEAPPDGSVGFAGETLRVPARWPETQLRAALREREGADWERHPLVPVREEYELPVAVVLINRRVALMTMPGEPFIEFQMEWRDRCPVRDAFFAGYANGYSGYFPTLRAASEGGYGAADVSTRVEPGTGERMLDRAVVMVNRLLGRLKDKPEIW